MTTKTRRALGATHWGGPFLLGVLLVSLAANRQERTPAEKVPANSADKAPEKLQIRGIENTFRLSPRLYSGGDPRGVEALTALKDLGIKTIISVDGATPDVETARKLGIRYVHLPIGYDGVPREQAVRLVKAVKTLPGPVYVHCHHGKHRGPAAAAVCGIATEGWSKQQAVSWMERAGTSPDYRGLYASAREFSRPSADEMKQAGKELPERAKVPDLVGTMVQVDERWDRLKAVQKAGFTAPADQPDIDPTHEALQLAEQFREASRLAEVRAKGEDFSRKLGAVERQAADLQEALRGYAKVPSSESRKGLEAAFIAVGRSCSGCHARYRNN
ncbi:MAG: hypothetical protein JWN86_3316 [Planctomycetota bacterium]|nr:hypothetical protein [Planctomycetota bacterium]